MRIIVHTLGADMGALRRIPQVCIMFYRYAQAAYPSVIRNHLYPYGLPECDVIGELIIKGQLKHCPQTPSNASIVHDQIPFSISVWVRSCDPNIWSPAAISADMRVSIGYHTLSFWCKDGGKTFALAGAQLSHLGGASSMRVMRMISVIKRVFPELNDRILNKDGLQPVYFCML